MILKRGNKVKIKDRLRKDFYEPYHSLEYVTILSINKDERSFYIEEDNGVLEYYFDEIDNFDEEDVIIDDNKVDIIDSYIKKIRYSNLTFMTNESVLKMLKEIKKEM